MELQFNKTAWSFLAPVVSQIKNEEQTQEFRLPEGMPDIGRVLGAWGQTLVRGKEWRNSAMAVSGGVMAWVLYEAEDGTGLQSVETWLPFQMKWDLPQIDRDGDIQVAVNLSSMDARSVSARKLMIRCNVSALGIAWAPQSEDVYTPQQLPEDVQLLRRTYPVQLVREAGESQIPLDEELQAPADLDKILRCSIQPEILDQKVMADKAVFRGSAAVHILYRDSDGGIHTMDTEVPFSQFSELEQEYPNGQLQVIPAVTALELDTREPGHLLLKGTLLGQYTVSETPMVELIQDAYSTRREVIPQMRMLELPAILDEVRQSVHLEAQEDMQAAQILDTAFLGAMPAQKWEEDGVALTQNGAFQLLYREPEGQLRGQVLKAETEMTLPMARDARLIVRSGPLGRESAMIGAGQVSARGEMQLVALAVASQGLPMVTGLELGQEHAPDPNRPSLILRRPGADDLWTVAKAAGSTVEAISQANGLTAEPEPDRMLLIPVL